MLEKKGSSAEGAEETGGWTNALLLGIGSFCRALSVLRAFSSKRLRASKRRVAVTPRNADTPLLGAAFLQCPRCVFAPSADVANRGDGAESALREILFVCIRGCNCIRSVL